MPLETATYISDLVSSNPAASDGLNNADDHMRLIKACVRNTFPNFTAASLTSTQAQIDAAVAEAVTRSAGVPVGAICDFAMVAIPAGWLECNGQSVATATYPALFAKLGYYYGGAGATFQVPNTGDRFRRSRGSAISGNLGTQQGPQNLSHSHAISGAPSVGTLGTASNGDHFHAASINDPGHSHGVASNPTGGTLNAGVQGGGTFTGGVGPTPIVINSATTGIRLISANGLDNTSTNGAHVHTINGAPGVGSLATVADGGTEARPYSMTFVTCIKT